MKIEGSCHCGARSVTRRGCDPGKVVICHCTDCQTVSGAPYRANVPVLAEKFTLHGEPKTYEKIAASGNVLVLAFCGGECGSALYSAKRDEPAVFNLRLRRGETARRTHAEGTVLVPLRHAMGNGVEPHPAGARPDPAATPAGQSRPMTKRPRSSILVHAL